MLDKSIEWFRVILKRNRGTPLPPVLLPPGYAFVIYQEEDGEKIANFMAWWGYTGNRRYPFMRRVSLKSTYQGLGSGKAIIAEGVRRMVEIEGDVVMYIPTMTWSHKAIRLYRWAGFELDLSEPCGGYLRYPFAK